MDSLASDVLREIKRKELRNRILIIIISAFLLILTNAIWFIRWNAPPKQSAEEEILSMIDGDDDDDTPQSINEKSK